MKDIITQETEKVEDNVKIQLSCREHFEVIKDGEMLLATDMSQEVINTKSNEISDEDENCTEKDTEVRSVKSDEIMVEMFTESPGTEPPGNGRWVATRNGQDFLHILSFKKVDYLLHLCTVNSCHHPGIVLYGQGWSDSVNCKKK
jgi:hypothetical protein